MHTKRNNVEIMIGSETDEIIEDLFESFLRKYREGLEESMTKSEFVYASVDVLYYNLNKVSLSRGGSYIDSPNWHYLAVKSLSALFRGITGNNNGDFYYLNFF